MTDAYFTCNFIVADSFVVPEKLIGVFLDIVTYYYWWYLRTRANNIILPNAFDSSDWLKVSSISDAYQHKNISFFRTFYTGFHFCWPHKSLFLFNILSRVLFLHVATINVDSSDLTRKFIWTILRKLHTTVITHTFAFDSTQTRVF
jgi:hypothetical protein